MHRDTRRRSRRYLPERRTPHHLPRARWHRHRGLLVRHIFPPYLDCLPAQLRLALPHLRPQTLGLPFLPPGNPWLFADGLVKVIVALGFFTLGSTVAAIAKNFTVLIVGRTLQGVGGGGVIALNEILITDLIPLRLRGKWLGLLNSIWAVGTVSGPLVGGGLAQKGQYNSELRIWVVDLQTMLKGLV